MDRRVEVAADTMPCCRTPDPRRLPAVRNRGKRPPPCRLTANRRHWFGGYLSYDRVVDANGHAAARAVADTSISDNPPHAPGSALCMSLWDSFWQ